MVYALIIRHVKAAIVAKLEQANFRLVKADVAINARVAITDELAVVISTMFTRFKTIVTQPGLDFDTED